MNSIRLAAITIPPNRQRQQFDPEAMQELRASIEQYGLFHPPVLRKDGEVWTLVAGERRLRAMTEIFELGEFFTCNGLTFEDFNIPFTDIGTLSELDAKAVELDENLKRRDLTWQEHAAAVKELHELRVAQKDEAAVTAMMAPPDAQGNPPVPQRQTIADTAKELTGRSDGAFQDNVRKEIIVARNLHNPAVAKAKDVKEAFKILKAQEVRKTNAALALVVGQTFTAESHFAHNINCLDFMRDTVRVAPDGLFDVICTDPPYGMGADEFGDGGNKLVGIEHNYKDTVESWRNLMGGFRGIPGWCDLSFKVAKPQAHAYVFCDLDRFHELKLMMEGAGWYVFRTPLICIKPNSGRVPLPDRGPRRQWEMILYAIKGNKPVNHIVPDVITTNADENLGHGAQKPVALFENLLQRSVKPGDWVFDAFAGTGPIFPAAHGLKCIAVGCELNPADYGICLNRLKALKANENLDIFAGVA